MEKKYTVHALELLMQETREREENEREDLQQELADIAVDSEFRTDTYGTPYIMWRIGAKDMPVIAMWAKNGLHIDINDGQSTYDMEFYPGAQEIFSIVHEFLVKHIRDKRKAFMLPNGDPDFNAYDPHDGTDD